MDDLIADLERAQEGSRELDALIWAEQDNRDVRQTDNNLLLARHREPPHDECLLGYIDPGEKSRNFTGPGFFPNYTTSLDAALTMLPEGWNQHWIISVPGYKNGELLGATRVDVHHVLSSGGGPRVSAFGYTPALALCIASLRARREASHNAE